jgi:crossover junction endodeoxyribonuclease RuvC
MARVPAISRHSVASPKKPGMMRGMTAAVHGPSAIRLAGALPQPERRVLGIDPGLRRTGYAVLTLDGGERGGLIEAGLVRLNEKRSLEDRLVELEDGLTQIMDTHRPAVLACEQLYAHYKHPRTAILMGHARGVILALAARRGLAIVPVAATHVKKYLTGRGHAGKSQVQRAVAATLGLLHMPEPHDVADAIAIALCGRMLQRNAPRDVR